MGAGIPGIYFFFLLRAVSHSVRLSGGRGRERLASNRAQGRPGASALSAHAGAASVSSPLSLSSLPLPPSRPHLSSLSRPPLPPLHAPREPQAHRRRPRFRRRSARAVSRPPCLRDLRPWERLPAPQGALRISPLLFPRRWVAAGLLLPCPRRVYVSSRAGRSCPAKPGAASAWNHSVRVASL